MPQRQKQDLLKERGKKGEKNYSLERVNIVCIFFNGVTDYLAAFNLDGLSLSRLT